MPRAGGIVEAIPADPAGDFLRELGFGDRDLKIQGPGTTDSTDVVFVV